jgi:hypothetical protein
VPALALVNRLANPAEVRIAGLLRDADVGAAWEWRVDALRALEAAGR